ncbi:MAG: dihydrodipicolinate synthase family protein [Acidimicrobiia bacterium]|nr:dihydrodipicolinate synthase family protein [Acidimicrobiia bacterium]
MTPQKKGDLSGIFAPTLTGFHADGSISAEGTRRFVRFLLDLGVDGLTPLGSAGEPVALTREERKSLLEAIVDENAGKVPVYAGTGDYGTSATVELSLHAKSVGCDGLMLIAPFLLRPPKQDVLDHYRRIRDRVGLPIMIYNVPLLTGTEITPQEIQLLQEEDVVHSVKWSHLEVARIHDTRLLCGPQFPIFAGIDLIAFEAMAVGADGWISGLQMMVPALARRLHRLLTVDKNLEDARALWYRVLPLVNLEYRALGTTDGNPHWLAVCREAAALRGIPIGISRGPLAPVDSGVRAELRSLLEDLEQL